MLEKGNAFHPLICSEESPLIHVYFPMDHTLDDEKVEKYNHGLEKLANTGVVAAMRKLELKLQDENKHKKQRPYIEMGFEEKENPYISIYFNPVKIPIPGNTQDLWKSQGVKTVLLSDNSKGIYYRAAKWRQRGQLAKGIEESGWQKLTEIEGSGDLFMAVRQASRISTHTFDLRFRNEEGELDGRPEKNEESIEIVFVKHNSVMAIV